MVLPPAFALDSRALSGISGSISISCWIIVFTPQLYENFTRKSAQGLSLTFLLMWLVGDILNVAGSILQGVLPTTIALAIYYTIADIVLIAQVFLYSPKNPFSKPPPPTIISSSTPLLENAYPTSPQTLDLTKTSSNGTFDLEQVCSSSCASSIRSSKPSLRRQILVNTLLVTAVVLAGIAGWALSQLHEASSPSSPSPTPSLDFSFWGQLFGWGAAPIYLGSRIPQIVLNYQRKSVVGVSFLFFLFACLGNFTFIVSILALDCSYKYILINGSWLAGSLGALSMDLVIFFQFWIYNCQDHDDDNEKF